MQCSKLHFIKVFRLLASLYKIGRSVLGRSERRVVPERETDAEAELKQVTSLGTYLDAIQVTRLGTDLAARAPLKAKARIWP